MTLKVLSVIDGLHQCEIRVGDRTVWTVLDDDEMDWLRSKSENMEFEDKIYYELIGRKAYE